MVTNPDYKISYCKRDIQADGVLYLSAFLMYENIEKFLTKQGQSSMIKKVKNSYTVVVCGFFILLTRK